MRRAGTPTATTGVEVMNVGEECTLGQFIAAFTGFGFLWGENER